MYRSEASGDITVLLKESGYIRYEFITSSNCTLNIQNVAYSNDGTGDTISLFLNNTSIGSFTSLGRTGGGHRWNVIQNSGPVGNEVGVTNGGHTLTLEVVSADDYGVELDTLTLVFKCASNSTTEECPEADVNFTDNHSSSPDNESGGGGSGLSAEGIIGIVFGVVATLIGIPGCIAALYAIYVCTS